jgi:sugar phosphate isomerase/epimerase
MDRVYVSTTAFPSRDVSAILESCRAEGIAGLELSATAAVDEGTPTQLMHERTTGMRFLVHNYFPPPAVPFVLNLAADDAETRTRSVEHCRTALALGARLHAPFYSVHAGFAARLSPSHLGQPLADAPRIPRRVAYANFVECVAGLCDVAGGLGLRLLIENNVVAPFNLVDGRNELLLLADADEIVGFCRDVAHPALRLLMDVGHLKVSARALGFDAAGCIKRTAPWIEAFHLSDNDGTHDDNRPFDREAWFLPLLADLQPAAVVVEVNDLSPSGRRQCCEIAAEALH